MKKHNRVPAEEADVKKMSMRKKEALFGWVFVMPFIIGFLVFMAYPLFTSIRLSVSRLNKSTGISDMTFIGIDHFRRAFTEDVNFVPNLLSTIQDALVNTPFIMVFSLIIAILLNKKIRLRPFFRLVFFLPFVLGTGYIANMLSKLGVTDQSTAMVENVLNVEGLQGFIPVEIISFAMDFMERVVQALWKSSVQVLLFLSGLQGISGSLYESARVDSATEWEMFWKITMPMISPTMLLVCIYTIIDSFTDINNAIIQYFYTFAFTGNQYEYASAIAWVYFAFIAVFLGVAFGIFKPLVFYAGEK